MENRTNYRILIVDDDTTFHATMRNAFQENYEFESAISVERMWEKLQKKQNFDLLLLDLRLDDTEEYIGLQLIPELKQKYPHIPIIVVTNENDSDTTLAAMDAGAKHYLFKGKYDRIKWDQKFQDAIAAQNSQKLAFENKKLKKEIERRVEQEEDEKFKFIGKSAKVAEIKTLLEGLAKEPNVSILLTGETGVGKEVAARYLHKKGPRAEKPFIAVNLSNMPETMVENELFGHEKGAFSDAKTAQKGYFHQADSGIILLDEIGHIPRTIQDKLMRFMENRTIYPLGSGKAIELDVQLITATNLNLAEEVNKGNFRADLYQRLKMFVIELPPLRHRKEDIPDILEHYFRLQIPNADPYNLMTKEVFDHLLDFDWPGNIRELRHTVEYMLLRKRIFSKSSIDMDCLPEDVRNGSPLIKFEPAKPSSVNNTPFKNKKEEDAYLDLVKIEAALRSSGNKKGAVEILGFKGTDHMRSRVRTCTNAYTGPLDSFPLILENYESVIRK